MANETMTVNRLPALTWNWLKMNAARLEANAPAVGAAPSFVQTAQLARSSAAQDWAMETGRQISIKQIGNVIVAVSPSSSSMRISWLYFAKRSERRPFRNFRRIGHSKPFPNELDGCLSK